MLGGAEKSAIGLAAAAEGDDGWVLDNQQSFFATVGDFSVDLFLEGPGGVVGECAEVLDAHHCHQFRSMWGKILSWASMSRVSIWRRSERTCPPAAVSSSAMSQARLNWVAWPGEALDAVIDGTLGVDDEGPIAGLEEEKLAAGALHHLGDLWIGAPGKLVQKLEHVVFGAVFDFPNPAGLVVDPDAVIAVFAPGAFGEAGDFVRGVAGEGFFGGQEFDAGIMGEGEDDVAEEARAFEPPVAEEFGIEWRDADAGAAGAVAMFVQDFANNVAEMLGVLVDAGAMSSG